MLLIIIAQVQSEVLAATDLILEHQPETKLNVPRRSQRGRDDSSLCVTNRCVRQIELRVVEHVEQLSAKLNVDSVRNSDVLEQRSVEIKAAGASQDISARFAERVQSWG